MLNGLKQLTPIVSKETFSEILDEFDILDYIEKVLK